MRELSLTTYTQKSALKPTKQITFLGFVIDSVRMIITLRNIWKKGIFESCLTLSCLKQHRNKRIGKNRLSSFSIQGSPNATNVISKARGRIAKRVLQENKARQIFRKANIYYPLICTGMCAYQGVKNVCFPENLARFIFLKHPFWGSPFCLIAHKHTAENLKIVHEYHPGILIAKPLSSGH